MTPRFEDNSVSIGRTLLVRLNQVVDGADTAVLEKLDIEPATSPVLTQMREGEALKAAPNNVQGVGAGFVPDMLDLSLVDDVWQVTKDGAILYARRLTRRRTFCRGSPAMR
jgi:cysteine synthase